MYNTSHIGQNGVTKALFSMEELFDEGDVHMNALLPVFIMTYAFR